MTTFEDPHSRLVELADTLEPAVRKRFLELVASVKDKVELDMIESLILSGHTEQAIALAEGAALGIAHGLAAEWNTNFAASGIATSDFLERALLVVVDFDQTNEGAVRQMQSNKLTTVAEIVAEQRAATQTALIDGIRDGLNPKEVARTVRESIGLTQKQMEAVANYRRLLNQGSTQALQRQLRDRRFDPTVRRAIDGDGSLTRDQINRMVERYQARYVDYRSRVIARTEALRAANAGNHQMFVQAVEDGTLDEAEIQRKWLPGHDGRTRMSHIEMDGQVRGLREEFLSGAGNHLLYPGDPSGPAEDTIQCRCAVTTRIKKKQVA